MWFFFCFDLCLRVFGRMCMVIIGVNSIVMIYDSSSVMVIIVNRVKVYLLVELVLSLMGMKLVIVIRVLVSIGKVVEV